MMIELSYRFDTDPLNAPTIQTPSTARMKPPRGMKSLPTADASPAHASSVGASEWHKLRTHAFNL